MNEGIHQSREFIRHHISQFPEILDRNENSWWRDTAKFLISFRRELQFYPDIDIRDYFLPQVDFLLQNLRKYSSLAPKDLDDFVSFADHMIMNFSMETATLFETKEFKAKVNFISLEEIVALKPERFNVVSRNIKGVECLVLQVKHPTQNYFQDIPLPVNRKVWHKGGPARAVLGVIADSPVSMQESEFPWNDFDAMVANKMINKKAALKIGVDADGIEYMGEDELNFPRYCAGRDTTQNQVCLGSEGIYFSDEALFTAVSGHTRAENEYVSNKAIYGFDTVIVEGVVLAKPRALMRLVKALVEGKALSFDYLPLNACLDFGTNTLFLAKRWSKKENFSENLQKMFYLLTMMDQTRADEKNVLDTLERVHTEYPFFDFNSEVRLPIEVLRWKSRKLIKQMDREMGWRFHIPTGLEVQRSHGDTIAKFISLDGFILTENNSITEERWSGFLKRCEQRTYEYRKEGLTAYEKIFTKSSLDEETPKFYEGDH